MGSYTSLPNLYLPGQSGAPLASGINNTAGELITLLDAILVTGYGSVTLNSLVVADEVATATVSTGHGFVNVGTYGPVVLVEGATPADLNGNKRIQVLTSTTFSFAATGVSDGSATGTITAKMAPAGWTKEYSGTNKAVYRPASGLRHYLRVDDSVGAYARVRGFVTMSDVDTGTEPFPTDAQISGGGYAHKSNGTTRRTWMCAADARHLHLFMDADGSTYFKGTLVFGQVIGALPGDAYCTQLISASSSPIDSFVNFNSVTVTYGSHMPRVMSQVATAGICARTQAGKNTIPPGAGAEVSPPACGFSRFFRVELWQDNTAFRGWIPGVYSTSYKQLLGDVTEGFDGELAGRALYAMTQGTQRYAWQVDITGPWYDD